MTSISHLSEHLRATRNKMADNRHGGLVMHGDYLEAFIRRFDAFIAMATAIETALQQMEAEVTFHRACDDLAKSKTSRVHLTGIDLAADANVTALRGALDDLRDTNIIRFPINRSGKAPVDGDIA
jgi:hypothetical protein